MITQEAKVYYIGTATALLEIGGLRLLTDPAFDPAGTTYTTPVYTLHKLMPPKVTVDQLGHIDYVLLSHDHHLDNLDHAGIQLLTKVEKVITTTAGAERLNHQGARLFDHAVISPLHFEGWEHFSEGSDEIIRQYTAAGLLDRLHWAPPYSPAK
jgi:L-ascorbate metabolism protein UlaG (beta-lactamase superfamily)